MTAFVELQQDYEGGGTGDKDVGPSQDANSVGASLLAKNPQPPRSPGFIHEPMTLTFVVAKLTDSTHAAKPKHINLIPFVQTMSKLVALSTEAQAGQFSMAFK